MCLDESGVEGVQHGTDAFCVQQFLQAADQLWTVDGDGCTGGEQLAHLAVGDLAAADHETGLALQGDENR